MIENPEIPKPGEKEAFDIQTLGGRLAWARNQAGLTVGQAERHVHANVQKIERGVIDIPEHELAVVAAFYGVHLDWIKMGVEQELSEEMLKDIAQIESDQDRQAIRDLLARTSNDGGTIR